MKQNKSVKKIYSVARDLAIEKNAARLCCAHLCAALAQDEMFIEVMDEIECVDASNFVANLILKSDEAMDGVITASENLIHLWNTSGVKRSIDNGADVEMLNRIMDEHFIPVLPETVKSGYESAC